MSTQHKQLTEFLLDNGWKNCPTMDKISPEIIKELWVKKNEGAPSFCLNFVCVRIHGIETNFVSLDITGEVATTWYKLEAYSMSIDHFISNHEIIEQQLINSWRALLCAQ